MGCHSAVKTDGLQSPCIHISKICRDKKKVLKTLYTVWVFSKGLAVVSLSRVQLCSLMDCSMPGFPVLHHLLEFAQIQVHWIGDAIQPFHPLLPFAALLRFPGGTSGKESTYQCRRHRRCGFSLWVNKIPWRRKWQFTSVFLPGKSHGQRNLAGYSPCGCIELDLIEQLSTPYNSEGEE